MGCFSTTIFMVNGTGVGAGADNLVESRAACQTGRAKSSGPLEFPQNLTWRSPPPDVVFTMPPCPPPATRLRSSVAGTGGPHRSGRFPSPSLCSCSSSGMNGNPEAPASAHRTKTACSGADLTPGAAAGAETIDGLAVVASMLAPFSTLEWRPACPPSAVQREPSNCSYFKLFAPCSSLI